jgi:hypothetical protein
MPENPMEAATAVEMNHRRFSIRHIERTDTGIKLEYREKRGPGAPPAWRPVLPLTIRFYDGAGEPIEPDAKVIIGYSASLMDAIYTMELNVPDGAVSVAAGIGLFLTKPVIIPPRRPPASRIPSA